eukprot:SAG31_NODE_36503_length_312_cov_1.938967_1_plen_40_part_10
MGSDVSGIGHPSPLQMTSCVREHESLGVAEEVEQESEHEG